PQPDEAGSLDSDSDSAETDSESDSDGEYVYDTYVRVPVPFDDAQSRDAAAPSPSGQAPPSGPRLGVLVIRDEDAPYWEDYFDYGDAAQGFGEGDSDDEDSNAEDHYANDYPEEEEEEEEQADDDYDSDSDDGGARSGWGGDLRRHSIFADVLDFDDDYEYPESESDELVFRDGFLRFQVHRPSTIRPFSELPDDDDFDDA
ncbi:hypothetical protein KEM52_006648, partial [Ascosphaera acerosa]